MIERCPVCTNQKWDSMQTCGECYWHVTAAQNRAGAKVSKETQSGRLPKVAQLMCVDCGAAAFAYDHRRYLEPLNVVPVCRKCNRLRGNADDIFVAARLERERALKRAIIARMQRQAWIQLRTRGKLRSELVTEPKR